MIADMRIPEHNVNGKNIFAEISCLKAIYTSADEKGRTVPDEVMRAICACRRLSADVIAVELDDRTIIAAVNDYDDAYAAAICDADTALPAVARSLQGWLFNLSVPDIQLDIISATIVRKSIGRWERRIAVVFGDQYAARLVSAFSPAKPSGAVTIDDMENMRTKLSSSLGDCIDLPEFEKG